MDVKKCNVLAAEIRLETLKVIHSRGFGHVGGSMASRPDGRFVR